MYLNKIVYNKNNLKKLIKQEASFNCLRYTFKGLNY